MKKLLFAAFALVIAVSVSAFVSEKKPEATQQAETETTTLYWYRVTYDPANPAGAILSSSDFHVQDNKADVISPCDAGASRDCLRGFANPLSSFPEDAPGMDNIQKP